MPKKLAALIVFALLMGLLTAALLNSAQSNQAQAAQTLPPLPASLKPQLMLGVSNRPGHLDWLTSSGAKWDMRYQYLVGGVNTSNNWTTWDSPAGKYADDFTYESASAGLLPVFTYYQLLSSQPASGSNEADKDYNNLNNPATMRAYFADFKLLMDKSRTFDKPVVVHIEPDLWGFLQKRSTNPAAIQASVASSGYGDVATYPDTAAGFAQALVGLRNKYAPKVLLAYHISPWGASQGDIGFSRDPNFNVQGAAQETANFYLATKANFDLIFYDISDRDAGYYDSLGDLNHWWDASNSSFPNFNRWHQYLTTLTNLTGKRGMLWQVPIGNTLYKTMNNTSHHWQDNRVQYYLNEQGNQHLQDLANAGIVGILFGPGDQQSTWNDDNAGDGITNPGSLNGNNLAASFSDDDGGYLRLQAKAYYSRGPVALASGSTVANPTATSTALATARPTNTAAPTATPTQTTAPTATNTAIPVATSTKTIAPTVTPVNTVVPTAIPTQTTAPVATPTKSVAAPKSWQMSAKATGPLTPDSPIKLTASFTAPAGTSGSYLVNIELHDMWSDEKVAQWFTTTTFTPGQVYTFQNTWTGQPGRYQIRLGVFTPDWGKNLAWLQNGPVFEVN